MRSRLFRQVAILSIFACVGAARARADSSGRGPSQAKSKGKGKSAEVGDTGMDPQMAWEKKVMGEDAAKRADLKKIAAAQKLADESRKHPAPLPAPKVKDPNKEGVRAKQEASIGLPIASEEEAAHRPKKMSAPKKAAAPGSADDELGALVASSLAGEKSTGSAQPASRVAKAHQKAKPAGGSALDDLLSNPNN